MEESGTSTLSNSSGVESSGFSIASSIESSVGTKVFLNAFTLQDGLFTADKSGRMSESQANKVKAELVSVVE